MDEFHEDLLAHIENMLYCLYCGQGDTLGDDDCDLIKCALAKVFDDLTPENIPSEMYYKIKGYGAMKDIQRHPLRSK
jgi:hypothetical protein